MTVAISHRGSGPPRIRTGRATQRLCGRARARRMEIGETE